MEGFADTQLMEMARSDPQRALAALFEAYADRVYRLALSILADPASAEDVVQDTFLSALTHLDSFEGRSQLSTWLHRIAYNAAVSRLRRKPESPLPEDEPGETGEDAPIMPRSLVEWRLTPEELSAGSEAAAELEAAVRRLPETLRSVFILRDVEGLSTEETAEVLNLGISAVKVRLHRARLTLREMLSGYFSERAGLRS